MVYVFSLKKTKYGTITNFIKEKESRVTAYVARSDYYEENYN